MEDFLRFFFLLSLVTINIIVSLKYKRKFDFIEVDVLDNNANWVYNNKLYNAKIVNGKVDNKNVRELSL
jgi:hypothetical protein